MNFTQHKIQKLTRFIKTSKTDRSIDAKKMRFVLLTSQMRCNAMRFDLWFHFMDRCLNKIGLYVGNFSVARGIMFRC